MTDVLLETVREGPAADFAEASSNATGSMSPLVTMNEDRMICTVHDHLQSFNHRFGWGIDLRIFVGQNVNLGVVDAMQLHEVGIRSRILFGYKSTKGVSPCWGSHDLYRYLQDSPEVHLLQFLEVGR